MYYVSVSKNSLLSISQIFDKVIKVNFLFDWCTVIYLESSEVILRAKGSKNMYDVDMDSVQKSDLTCLSA